MKRTFIAPIKGTYVILLDEKKLTEQSQFMIKVQLSEGEKITYDDKDRMISSISLMA